MPNLSHRSLPRPRSRHRILALLAVAAGIAASSSTALAGNEITRFAAGPIAPSTSCNPNLTPDDMLTTAAARTDMCIAFYLDGGAPAKGDDIKEAVVETPQGFLASADTSPSCTLQQFQPESTGASACPADSQVGEADVQVRIDFMTSGLIIPQSVHGKVFNLVHSPDEVAQLGMELTPELGGVQLPRIKLMGRIVLRPNPDVGLRTTFGGQPRFANLGSLGMHPIAIDAIFMRLWGAKSDHPALAQDFGLMGSDCSVDQVARIKATSWSGDTDDAEDRYRLTDCANVPFGVSAKVETTERRPDVPSETKVTVSVAQHSSPRVTGNMTKTVLTLPAGLEMGAQVASGGGGLPLCKAADFAWDRLDALNCPPGSRVADVDIVSPLQVNHFLGAAYLGEQPAPGELPQLFIEGGFGSKPDAPRVKLRGTLRIAEDGRIEATLDDLPQVLFETFTLTFRGGDHAPLITPRDCGTTTGSIEGVPASTRVPQRTELSLTIDQDCVDPARFEPEMSITTTNPQAGGRTVLKVKTSRPDRTARISKLVADLPPGIMSDLRLATECVDGDAAAGACPASSRIGTLNAESGVGAKPQTITGDVYLGQRQEGAVAGIIIATKVAFGDIDLGRLNLPARVDLRDGDLGLRLTADIPQRYKGLSLNLRSFEVTLDRPDFAINPTSCTPLSSTSTLFSDRGTSADVPLTLQVSGCESLAFDPGLGLSLAGKMGQGDKPTVGIDMALAGAGSNLRSAAVILPTGLGADLKQVPRACTGESWTAGTCHADATIGTVTARIAITDEVIPGKVKLVKLPGETLPGIGIQLEGRFSARILGRIAIDRSGRLITRVDPIPDVPLTQLQLVLDGGPRGALISTKTLCATGRAVMKGDFVGQSGATASRETAAICPAVPKSALLVTARGTTRTALRFTLTAPADKKLKTAAFTLPSGITVNAKKVGKNRNFRGTSTSTLRGKRTVAGRVPSAGLATFTVTIPRAALLLSASARKKKTFSVTLRVGYTDGKRETAKVLFKR